jgi:hypothetical protein
MEYTYRVINPFRKAGFFNKGRTKPLPAGLQDVLAAGLVQNLSRASRHTRDLKYQRLIEEIRKENHEITKKVTILEKKVQRHPCIRHNTPRSSTNFDSGVIYDSDHLIDGWELGTSPECERHAVWCT